LKLGKFGENKIAFRDTTTGYRGLQYSQERRSARYRLCWFGRVPIPARGTATNMGGTARFGRTKGGAGIVVNSTRFGTYAQGSYAHGIASVGGFIINMVNTRGIGQRATAPGSLCRASMLNASVIFVSLNAYTAATAWINLLVWGSTTLAY